MLQSATPAGKPVARRHSYRLLSLALLLIALALTLPAAASAFVSTGGATWSAQTSGSGAWLKGVDFPDATHGWAVGYSYDAATDTDTGVILATADGGATWNKQTPGTTVILNAVSFIDATHGWAVGGGGTILATADGGATWNKQMGSTGGYWLNAVSFIDATHGWAVGDGGRRYVNGIPIYSIVFLATTNGGTTWKVTEVTSSWVSINVPSAVAFSDATHGWAVGMHGSILATTDGGATWNYQASGSGAWLSAVAFSDATHGWAVGDGGCILATTNGGATWSAQTSGSGAWLMGVAFPDVTHGWAVGRTYDLATDTAIGAILATTDGGATWNAQWSGNGVSLGAVAFSDATHGWAVGGGGAILATTTGGKPPVVMPNLTSFTPASGPVGTSVTVTGTGFTGATKVAFNGSTASFTVDSATQITASVPAGATTGPITVTTPGGSAASAASFAVIPAPTLTGFTPTSGPVGTPVTLTGTHFTGATKVAFHGTSAVFSVNSATKITATVPSGATTGTIAVTTPGGSAASATSFTVTTPVVTPTLTLKLSGLKRGAIKLHKRVTAKGTVTPASLAGSKVKLQVQKKKARKWVTLKTVRRTISATGAYSWKYKPAKRGAYRMRAQVAKTARHTAAKTVWRSFKVK